jgi:hypothetical protein
MRATMPMPEVYGATARAPCAFRRPAPASSRSAPSITKRLTIEEHERDGDDEEEHLIEWARNRC